MTWLLPSPEDVRALRGSYRTVGKRPVTERRRVQARMWYAKNRERLQAYHRAYYHAKRKGKVVAKLNRAKRNVSARARYWRNPEKFRAEARARMAGRYVKKGAR